MQLRDFLGAPAEHPAVAQLLKEQHLPYAVAPAPERGTVAFTPGKGESYTIEEAVVSRPAAMREAWGESPTRCTEQALRVSLAVVIGKEAVSAAGIALA